ncbi:flagellar basal body-associated FliL family protein [Halanaerobium salsuginis]|jgi:flagellar FliL protein|uniref:Flagellar protein FliL n=1 Tax=Halanaerobium salsuginis TaxID=29563 RepID=A0A1I4KI30_9FIRM|nr:flagellar basal body-associated FliL family protein [Halanaerobium salsuginis]SFL78442.1 flagellar FliL protein [Halanaerobium salsuginis]
MAEEGQMNYKMLALIVVLVIVITGVASFTFFTYFSVSGDKDQEEKKVERVEDIRPTYNAGDFTVNITENSRINFVRASIVFEIENEDLVEELDKRSSQIRDRIISTLRAQNESILEEPGADTIKEIVKTKINDLLISGEITNVWFTELVVQ